MQYALSNSLTSAVSGLDPDAKAYIAAVEAADAQSLESGVKLAINNFIKGCKSDGIWEAIKSSCILSGARTLSGALVPLRGTAPTNFNFVSGDYNRKTGLIGNGTTKYLNSNRNNNADPQNSKHFSFCVSSIANTTTPIAYFGGDATSGSTQVIDTGTYGYRINSILGETSTVAFATGFFGASRASATASTNRIGGTTRTSLVASASPTNENLLIYRRVNATGVSYSNARLSFYSIGEALNLATLDSRVSTLIASINSTIP